jgi:hypothetical protein
VSDQYEWERRYRDFSEIMEKLDMTDLQSISFIFDCYPHHSSFSEIRKEDLINAFWTKHRDLRHNSESLHKLREALHTIGCKI